MYERHMMLTNRKLQDLNPLVAGEQRCKPCHSYGPKVRKYTILHYVLSGKGVLYSRGGAHSVSAGQAFLILPGEVTTYTADRQDPWHYCWIGFNGSLSKVFETLPPVINMPKRLMSAVLHPDVDDRVAEYRLTGMLFQIYSHLFSDGSVENHYVRQVEDYIHNSYMIPIRVEQIAQQLSLNRRYISRLFKEKTGRSIQEYLIEVRMEAAEQFLRKGYSVKETASMCGYEDASNFSKMFKIRTGKPPAAVKGIKPPSSTPRIVDICEIEE